MMIQLPGIETLDVNQKRVVLRVDFNVPIDKESGNVSDNSRIVKTLPTLELLLKKGASVVIISHLGRPKSPGDPSASLKPVAAALRKLLEGHKIEFAPHSSIEDYVQKAKELNPGEILLLDNIRYYEEETSDQEKIRRKFATALAKLGNCYVNDAFGACHRAHASVAALPLLLPSAAGLLLKKEIQMLSSALTAPKRPFVAIVGGAKVSSKIKVLKNLVGKVDHILIGGAMAYTFLKAKGLKVGTSLVENELLSQAFQINDLANYNECGFYLPEDHTIASEYSEKAKSATCGLEIPDGMMGMDIGPKTIKKYEKIIKDAATVIWNGPMGVFEMDQFDKGTLSVAKAVSKVTGTTIIGGGDSMAAIKKSGLEDKITHISTGGGATLEFLEGKKLPGVEALLPGKEDE